MTLIGLSNKGGKGKRVMKLPDGDQVVSVCVVSGNTAQEPAKPPAAWQLYMKDQPEASEAGFTVLPADLRRPYEAQEEAMKRQYREDLEKYHQEDNEELLLGSASGAVTRIKVSSVPVTTRLIRGRMLAKTKSDRISVATLLSSMEGDPNETQSQPSQSSAKSPSQPVSAPSETFTAPSRVEPSQPSSQPSQRRARAPPLPPLESPEPLAPTPSQSSSRAASSSQPLTAPSAVGSEVSSTSYLKRRRMSMSQISPRNRGDVRVDVGVRRCGQ
eukprot:g27002.t1